jgi:hypothetical protein
MYKTLFAIGLIIITGCGRHKPEPGASLSYHGFNLKDITIVPEHPSRMASIRAQWTTEGEAKLEDSLTIEVEWLVNGQALEEAGNVQELNPTYFHRDDKIIARLVLKSKGNVVNTIPSNQLVAENSPPMVMDAYSLYIDITQPWLGYKMFVYAEDKDNDSVQFKYSWLADGKQVSDGPTLPGSAVVKGQPMKVIITPNDGITDGRPFPLDIGQNRHNNPPVITSTPPSEFSAGQFVYQVAANDPDGDSLTYALKEAPEGMTMDAGGCIHWKPGGPVKDKATVSIEVSDGNGGHVGQQFNLGTK